MHLFQPLKLTTAILCPCKGSWGEFDNFSAGVSAFLRKTGDKQKQNQCKTMGGEGVYEWKWPHLPLSFTAQFYNDLCIEVRYCQFKT